MLEIQSKQPSTKGPAEMFTGDVWYDVIAKGEPPSRLRVNLVRFAPGARTAWHRHANGQTLHVTDGRGVVQSRGGEVIEKPGRWRPHRTAQHAAAIVQPAKALHLDRGTPTSRSTSATVLVKQVISSAGAVDSDHLQPVAEFAVERLEPHRQTRLATRAPRKPARRWTS